ncbi:hypothetical protein P2T68_02060 [Pseudomonas sp. G11]|uniref:endonuclease/exonuclease/phosphatase family protein n=1 Tax=Pseudomonas sp. G11 TaxID=528343 RepID=UPI002402A856|nr:hypothetical protein [Pseudomonas sp. G11]WEX16137.1 hypothetical protein P2T68_02060 [Pseudomonas sp. G11]
MRLDQRNQAFPGHDLIHLNQETLTAGLLTFACVLGISERHLLHRGSTVQFVGQPYLTRFGSLFQSFPKAVTTEKRLKVGQKLLFKLGGTTDVWVILCHWQSLQTYSEGEYVRVEIALQLRGYVEDIYEQDPNALIIICGDFNDEPFSMPIQMTLKASRDISYVKARSTALFNPTWRLIGMNDLVTGRHLPAGTCSSSDARHMTNWRTFDQIILSSGFLRDEWSFVGSGVEIMSNIMVGGNPLSWKELSDHYPITCNLKRAV